METLQHELVPLNQKEMIDTTGGVALIALIAAGLIIAAGTEIISDWDNFKAGLLGRPEIQN